MVLFTPITTVTFAGVKLSDSLFPTSTGRTIWTVPGWVEVVVVVVEMVLVEEVVAELVELLEVVLVDVVLLVGVAVDVVTAEVLVSEGVEEVVDVRELVVEADVAWVLEEVARLVLIDVLSPSDEEVGVVTCVDDADRVLLVVDASEVGWRIRSAANAPARRRRTSPAIRATVESRPATPGDFLASIL